MTGDIVARLRIYANRMDETRSTVLGLLLADAADEIERLRRMLLAEENDSDIHRRLYEATVIERDEARKIVVDMAYKGEVSKNAIASARGWKLTPEQADLEGDVE